MTPPKKPWTWCRETGCDTKLIFARYAGTDRLVPFEYADRAPFSLEATGCRVIVAGEAWVPRDLIEDFQVRLSISTEKARELVSGYPFHRPHFHERDKQTPAVAAEAVPAIRKVIEANQFRYVGELGLQQGLFEALDEAGLAPMREVRFDAASRIDFMVGRVGVEVKVDGTLEAVMRQLQRYAPHVDELVLVTTKSVHRVIPETVGGKPCHVILIRRTL